MNVLTNLNEGERAEELVQIKHDVMSLGDS